MTRILAQDVQQIFGQVSPPPAMNIGGIASSDPLGALGSFIGWGINIFLVVAGLFTILYLLWGAFDWITSAGDKERLLKAQNKITNAAIGIVLVIAVLVVFNVLAGQLLGIIVPTQNGFQLKIPTLQ